MEGVGFANEQMEGRTGFTGTHLQLKVKNEQQKICEIVTQFAG